MPFDGIVTRAVTHELQQKLVNGRITKIHQPTETELVFTVRNKRTNFALLFSIHPNYARFHITEDTYQNPEAPPMFCMHLRKYLLGGFIHRIEQDGMERIVTFDIQARDEIGDTTHKNIVVELMGRHSNVLLLNEDKSMIIDCLKHIPPSQNRYRTLLPGHDYIEPPSQDKLDPLNVSGEKFLKQLDFNAGRLDRQLVNRFMGISPFIAKEIVSRAHLGSVDTYIQAFLDVQSQIKNHHFKPMIYRGNREDFHVIPMTSFKGKKETFLSTNEMLDHFYSGKAERDRVKQQARDLERLIKNELQKNKRKLAIHEKTIKRAKGAQKYQRLGELLTAHMHLVSQGDASVIVIDYYDPDQKEVTIPLQTDKTPSENAQAFFTRYRKLKTSAQVVQREIYKTKAEIGYFEQLLQQIENVREDDLEEIREELREEGYLRKQRRPRRRKIKKPKPQLFKASDGTHIFVGRNNRQNDYLTHRLAHRDDIWLHTKDIPGSHVVIRAYNPSEKTLHEGAQLAAYFSRAQQSASVPVDYTHVRHVKKPRGGKPGFVTYDEQKTLFVTPNQELVERLQQLSNNG
ncbi:MAG TPA: NFACT RNA binding domain-containing protein [Virgibacillus sp.]|nr:NFACT RNA binding domain-containing protein [Virgibacillus sp.]